MIFGPSIIVYFRRRLYILRKAVTSASYSFKDGPLAVITLIVCTEGLSFLAKMI